MSHDERRIAVDDGKYTFFIAEKDYRITVLRHGEPWLVIEQGSNAIASLMSELIDARELVEAVMKWGGYDGRSSGPGKHGDLYEAIDKYRSLSGLPTTDAAPTENFVPYKPEPRSREAAIEDALKYDERIWRAYQSLKSIHREGLINALSEAGEVRQ